VPEKKDERRILVAEMSWLRRILGRSRRDRIRNEVREHPLRTSPKNWTFLTPSPCPFLSFSARPPLPQKGHPIIFKMKLFNVIRIGLLTL